MRFERCIRGLVLICLPGLIIVQPAWSAGNQEPRTRPVEQGVPDDRPPAALPGPVRAPDEYACTKDSDCVFLPGICPACPPCEPTWRSVGNKAALRRINKMRAIVDCPRITCRPCANKSNWLGDKPVCRHGRCTLDGKPLPCYEECLQQSSAQAVSWQAIEAHCRHSCDNQELNEKHITHVYTDLDGTMLTDRGEIPPENLQAARRFIAAGGKLGVATGRMPDSASSQAHSLGANLPLIFGNGAVITEPNGKLIKMEIIRERGDVQAMCRMILRGECKTIYTAWGNPETGDVRVGMNECRPADKPGYGVVRIRARQCKQHARLLSDLPGAVRNPQTIIESGDGPYLGISIAARGVSKAAAIQFVADRLNIPLRNLAYFGDSGNDTGALKMVHDQGGACFAMKNGTPGVKSACPRQTPSDNNHGGVAAALQTLIPDHP